MRKLLKRGIQLASLVPAVVLVVISAIAKPVIGRRRAFLGPAQLVALVPGMLGIYLRWAYYFMTIKKCSWDVTIEFGSFFSCPDAEVGAFVYIGAYSIIGSVRIGDRVRIASGVSIPSGRYQHLVQDEQNHSPVRSSDSNGSFTTIQIGHDTWIGERAVVMADVGARCIVGAGAVVCKPIPDDTVAVGVPARIVRSMSMSDDLTCSR